MTELAFFSLYYVEVTLNCFLMTATLRQRGKREMQLYLTSLANDTPLCGGRGHVNITTPIGVKSVSLCWLRIRQDCRSMLLIYALCRGAHPSMASIVSQGLHSNSSRKGLFLCLSFLLSMKAWSIEDRILFRCRQATQHLTAAARCSHFIDHSRSLHCHALLALIDFGYLTFDMSAFRSKDRKRLESKVKGVRASSIMT
jgi:hypothetical protein